jgi:glycogen debranching enzyme
MGLTFAQRDYEVDGVVCSERFFVPDGMSGFASVISGDLDFQIEPEFDLRLSRELSESFAAYGVEQIENGAVVWNTLPIGTYDDATETFLEEDNGVSPRCLYAAVQIVGDNSWAEMRPHSRHIRRVVFRKDQQRHRFLSYSLEGENAADHAPLWDRSSSHVYVPVRLQGRGHVTVVYGFGGSREEALETLAAIRDNLTQLEAQKWETATTLLRDASFESGSPKVDTAYEQVFTRLMDGLVARNAVAEDTALTGPATMILAGNQYFHDCWKRDENIALGFLLALGFYDVARQVVDDTWQLQDAVTGRLPQRIRAGEAPPYHSSDGTLWALWRLHQYWRSTGDEPLLQAKLPMVETFFRRSLECTVEGMLPSGRTTAPDYLWETWMDTHHTPRNGFPVEIQMLWIACLSVFRPLIAATDGALASRMAYAEAAAHSALHRFNLRGMPADSLDELGEPRDLITPNPYFCFGVGLDLGSEVEGVMRRMGRRQLAGRQGIVTLAPQDWHRVFSAEFLSDRRNVRGRRMRSAGKFNYHRGVEWNWLAQFFVQAELKYGDPDAAFRTYLQRQVDAALDHSGIGGISELFDLSGSRGPDFQAWSMSGFLEALHAFAGVRIDVPDRRIVVEPQIPRSWPHLAVKKWFGRVPFDVNYSQAEARQHLRIEFPWGEVPDADVEISLFLPAHHVARYVDAVLDGIPHQLAWRAEPVSNARRTRVRVTVPARQHIEVSVDAQRAAPRASLMQAG